jgi:glycerophosphoryl diester phosphodiesterase
MKWLVGGWLAIALIAAAGPVRTNDHRPATVEEFMRLGSPTRVIAHRGFSAHAPENTLAAVRLAIEAGADMVEVDVTTTADGHVICLHDATLDRTTDGRGPATGLTLETIRMLDAGSWFAPVFAGEPVPTLGEVLGLVEGRSLLNIEIKADAVRHGVVEGVAETIRRTASRDRVVVSSFSPEALRGMTLAHPEIVTVSLHDRATHAGRDPLEVVREAGSRGLNLSRKDVTPELVERCHRHGLPVGVYTVNSEREMRRLIRMGVDSLFTDRPDRLREVLRTLVPATPRDAAAAS